MKKSEIVQTILAERKQQPPKHNTSTAYAPSNIALCKYWGKREQQINLPMTSSLSLSLGKKGATTELTVSEGARDNVQLNGEPVDLLSAFGKRLIEFLDLFRTPTTLRFIIKIESSVPISAGLASSACGFAALIQALNLLFDWELKEHELSILARLGSGSACRSIWQGFVEWHRGVRDDGLDSHGTPIVEIWPELCLGLWLVSEKEKSINSRDAMQRTLTTSALYQAWPAKVTQDLSTLKQAISAKNFSLLGKIAESNALAMHATMLSAWPPICYSLPETLSAMQKIWELRQAGLPLFFTQDAGPNLKLLFLAKDKMTVQEHFPAVEIIQPFSID